MSNFYNFLLKENLNCFSVCKRTEGWTTYKLPDFCLIFWQSRQFLGLRVMIRFFQFLLKSIFLLRKKYIELWSQWLLGVSTFGKSRFYGLWHRKIVLRESKVSETFVTSACCLYNSRILHVRHQNSSRSGVWNVPRIIDF